MDAHSVSFTSDAERSTSRIWRDLSSYHRITVAQLIEEDMSAAASMMAGIGKVYFRPKSRKSQLMRVCSGCSYVVRMGPALQNGFEVTLIEARDRLGGRVRQVSLAPGYLVEYAF